MNDFKIPAQSETIKTEVVCPNDTNPMGILQGGRLVEWMDIAAAVCAHLHAGVVCVTASINKVEFRLPAKVGDIILIKAKINRAFSTSMEIGVSSYLKDPVTSDIQLLAEAFFTFVALSANGKPQTVIALQPQTPEEKDVYEAAAQRRNR